MKPSIVFLLLLCGPLSYAQKSGPSKAWVADRGDGSYRNPILHADYSDPDAIRVGEDFYMTSSSFEDVPGLPILHSKDLVNWTLIGHALNRQVPVDHFSAARHGEGVWAPALRYRNGEFYLYYPDPDFGIYLVKAKNPQGPWSEPILVTPGKGLIDPCPLWDDDGQAYLVHAYAGSRAGIKSVIVVKKMNAQGTRTTDEGIMVYDGHELDPTIEGPKFYKRNGYYYIFAPAGGVSTGWQLVLRSRHIYGPYERRVVMDQGNSPVNGPHQGAWVNTAAGEDWFLHFQDKEAYGRIVHLQPMKWIRDWPVIGEDPDGDGKGQPVMSYRKPKVGKSYPIQTPADSDEFNETRIGLQWQWMGNPKAVWAFPDPARGVLRLFSAPLPDSAGNLWNAPHVLLQKFPAESFTATARLSFYPNSKLEGETAGLALMGLDFATLHLRSGKEGTWLVQSVGKDASKGKAAREQNILKWDSNSIYLRLTVTAGARCRFSYSLDGKSFTAAGEEFIAQPGRWKGAKMGIFCSRRGQTNDAGHADFDWFRVE